MKGFSDECIEKELRVIDKEIKARQWKLIGLGALIVMVGLVDVFCFHLALGG